MKVGARILLALLAASAVVAAPVGAGNDSRVALMPLPKQALGADAIGLPLDPESGFLSNADAADDAFGPVTAAQLARLGRITGYHLDYDDAAGKALEAGHGLLQIETEVHLYRDAKAADNGLAFWRKDALGVTALNSAGLSVALEPFRANVGATTFACELTLKVKGKPTIYEADVMFSTGAVYGAVSVSGAKPNGLPGRAVSLARKLETRIGQVLAGKVNGPPVTLPAKLKAGPPPNGPNLANLALTAADLGTAKITHQGYKLDPDLSPISEYGRTMAPGGPFAYLDEEVALFHSATEAGYAVQVLGEVLSSGQLLKNLAATLFKDDEASFTLHPISGVQGGDEARGSLGSIRLRQGATANVAFLFVRVGTTTAFVTAITPAGVKILPSGLRELAARTGASLRAGLHLPPIA